MKLNYKTLLLSLVMFTISFATFALPPSPDEADPDPPASIGNRLVWLAIVGIAFAFYQIKLKKVKTV